MTNKEAIEILTNAIKNDIMVAEEDIIALAMAQKALEKQTPEKPRDRIAGYGGYCQCGNTVELTQEYCSKCGQRLDWSDDDD